MLLYAEGRHCESFMTREEASLTLARQNLQGRLAARLPAQTCGVPHTTAAAECAVGRGRREEEEAEEGLPTTLEAVTVTWEWRTAPHGGLGDDESQESEDSSSANNGSRRPVTVRGMVRCRSRSWTPSVCCVVRSVRGVRVVAVRCVLCVVSVCLLCVLCTLRVFRVYCVHCMLCGVLLCVVVVRGGRCAWLSLLCVVVGPLCVVVGPLCVVVGPLCVVCCLLFVCLLLFVG